MTAIARSGGGGHAETNAINHYGDRIIDLYTERRPCSSCMDELNKMKNPPGITYSFPWTSGDAGVQTVSNQALGNAVRGLFGR